MYIYIILIFTRSEIAPLKLHHLI